MRISALLIALVSLSFSLITTQTFSAQSKPGVSGDYLGSLGPLHVKLHLKTDAAGLITGTLDSVDQGALGIPCADFHLDGTNLTFAVPNVHGTWKGTLSADGTQLSGTWDQGSPQPLNFSRDSFIAAAKPSPVDGIWLGAIGTGAQSLHIQLHIKSDASGKEYVTFDSLSQQAMGLECANIKLSGSDFSFDLPVVKGSWAGKLSADTNTLTGTWNQGGLLPLNFTRQAAAITSAPAPPADPAIPPVSAAELQSVLDKDLAEALKSGQLAPATEGGVTIGISQHGQRHIFSYGTAKPDSIFEIGSITKTFTGLILAQLVEQGKLHFDDPVRTLLPPNTAPKPEGAEITLLDLATQHSGLPRMPDNFKPADDSNPYADYNAARLYEFVAKHGLAKPANPTYAYSNLGFGLLGQALAAHSGLTYPELLKQQVTAPLALNDTAVALTPEQLTRFIPGHTGDHKPAHPWDLDALAGAGAIRSTAADMLTYLEANLHPEAIKPVTPAAATLPAALKASHELRADALPGMRIALAWHYITDSGIYWHNGGTGGFTSYAYFNPATDTAVVVLLNTTLGPKGSFADRIGHHIEQRLAGKPAVSLAN